MDQGKTIRYHVTCAWEGGGVRVNVLQVYQSIIASHIQLSLNLRLNESVTMIENDKATNAISLRNVRISC
jgi:hypothetical protein